MSYPNDPWSGGIYSPPQAPAIYDPTGGILGVPTSAGSSRFYEVVARSPLGPMPYDYAVGVTRQSNHGLLLTLLQDAISFQVLGADPADWTQGYRLSGPNGPIAQRVARLIRTGVFTGSQADPAYWGLDGWYGAKTQTGFKLLGKGELQALGLV